MPKFNRKEFGNNLKKVRKSRGLTQENLAKVIGKDKTTIGRFESGRLSPNAEDIVGMARVCEEEGADGVSLVNTFKALAIDINKRKPVLANNTGGLSGPAIKPVAVRMVYQVAQAVNIPILGMGGIINGDDAVEFMLAGAKAISIGAGNFIDPYTSVNTVKGIEDYMEKYQINDINDIIGKVEMN